MLLKSKYRMGVSVTTSAPSKYKKQPTWYVLIVNTYKSMYLLELIGKLDGVMCVKSVSSYLDSSIIRRHRMLFVKMAASNAICNKILGLRYVYRFYPNNDAPITFDNVDCFSGVSKSSNGVKEAKGDIVLNSLVRICSGFFKDSVGYVREIDYDRNVLKIELELYSSSNVIVTEFSIFDTELVK